MYYKPPAAGEVATIDTFKTELNALEGISLGTIVLGDLNVHNERWLRHSNANNAEGTALKAACDETGLKQIVTQPTREEHLLDLVLTNMPDAKATVSRAIARGMQHFPGGLPIRVARPPRRAVRRCKGDTVIGESFG